MKKKGMAFEQVVKMIIALVVLVVVLGVFYVIFHPTAMNILGIGTDTAKGSGNVIDDLFRALGRKCQEGAGECNPVTNTWRTCDNGQWKTTDTPC
jgi:hypothetical protein